MAGKQARILSQFQINDLLIYASARRWPKRNRVIALLSVRAGLRAAEISKLTWNMVLDASGAVDHTISLYDHAAKNHRGRRLPLHAELRHALIELLGQDRRSGPVIRSERGGAVRPISIVIWFARAYREIGLDGCSSHSGRRTFITRAARLLPQAGGSLRDVQLLAGHRSIQTTQRYIDGDSDIQHKLVSLL